MVPADVAYPTDSGLLAKAVRRIAATGRRIQAAGGATRTRVRDRSRAAGCARTGDRGEAAAARGAGPRRGPGHRPADHRGTGELAERAATDAERLLANARRALRRADTLEAEQKLAAGGGQTRPPGGGGVGCAARSTT